MDYRPSKTVWISNVYYLVVRSFIHNICCLFLNQNAGEIRVRCSDDRYSNTVSVFNPNVSISGLSKVVPFPNSQDFRECLKSEPFCSDFRHSDFGHLQYNRTIERTERPKCLKSERLKSEIIFVRFSKQNVRISDIYVLIKFLNLPFLNSS